MRKSKLIIAVVLGMCILPGASTLQADQLVQKEVFIPKIAVYPQARSINMNMGLPSNSVRNIVQDKDGFMWFGTDNGLCRYDGYTVQLFANPHTKLDQYVSALACCDAGLIVGTSHGAYLLGYEGRNFMPINEKITSSVISISVDSEHNVWISTDGQGIFRYNLTNQECVNYPVKPFHGNVAATLVDVNNQVWALSNKKTGGLMRLNKSTDTFERVLLHGDATTLTGMAMLPMSDGSIMVGTWDQGLYQVSPDGTVKMLLSATLTNSLRHIHKLYEHGNYVLIGSDDGLVEYGVKEHTWSMLSEVENPSRSTAERFVYGITGDQEGGIWIGTFYGGVNYIPSRSFEDRFTAYTASYDGLKGNVVGRFAEDAQHRIWIATDDAGLDCLDPKANQFVNYPARSVMSHYNVHGLLAEGNDLWVGTYGSGVIKMNMSTGAMQTYQTDGRTEGGSCYSIYRDKKNRLWSASLEHVNLWDEKSQSFRPIGPIKGCAIDIDEDQAGNVWFATQGSGLWCYRTNNTWKQYKNVEGDSTSVNSNQINCVAIGSKGVVYVATNNGLCKYQPSTDAFQRIRVQAPSQDFSSIIAYQGELWISSTKGIVKYVPGEQSQVFNYYDGLTSDMFLPSSSLMASDGRIYFGTSQGFNCFYPYLVKINQVQPPVAITTIDLFNHRENEEEVCPQLLNHVSEVDLDHDENMFNISFAALSYVSPEKNLYRYKLDGFEKEWTLTNENRVTYTNLPAGTYTFRVKAANNDGVWSKNEATLKIVVHPPFWWSLPAKILYLLIIGYCIYWITQSRLKREKRRHQRELDQLEEKQEQEMRDARLQFFTMIAHEIRTPVTLIIGPLESLKEQWQQMSKNLKAGDAMTQTLDVIDRNAQRLLLLVNQLLDFSKVQQKDMQVHFKLQNISKLMRAVAERFEPMFRQRGINFQVKYPADDFAAMIDGEAITKVVSNLMTNAGKYTKDDVQLSFMLVDNEHFAIKVADNGMGISKEEQEKIFAAFYQARDNKPGTGIGLNIVKNLVDAHHGKVEVVSDLGKGSVFVVTLPINQADAVVEKADEVIAVPKMEDEVDDAALNAAISDADNIRQEAEKAKKPVMLVVDDDADMCQFIKSHFAKDYVVYTAENGKEALHLLEHQQVNLIVSDWMMPEMDGPELCRRIRSNENTSHLPFLMLTAKTDDASKAESRNCGADTFIEKPFSMKYLEACVQQLIDMRRLLQSKFSHTPLEPIAEIAPSKVDSDFLSRMQEIIEANLTNSELNVAFLAGKMGMSRSSLFNKIRGLANVTPNEMIMLVKLKKAAQLLKDKRYRVNEVSYMVGFSSASYFAKCFQKQFGVKPAEFIEMMES